MMTENEIREKVLDQVIAKIYAICSCDYGSMYDYRAHSTVTEVKRDIVNMLERMKGEQT